MANLDKQSKTEKVLLRELLSLGLNPKPQYEIGRMHVDFAFPNVKLVIEINGPHHRENVQHMTDLRRSYVIEKKGWKIKEYDSEEVYKNPKLFAELILNDIKKLEKGEFIDWQPKSLLNIEKKLDDNFKHLLELVENSEGSVFITGKAGTGKSTFLKLFVQKTEKNLVILAPTGLAAINVKGQTIHSFFKLRSGIINEEDIEKSVSHEMVKLLCSNMDYLIIDEISMVRADVFDAIDLILRSIRNSNEPFGGVKLILFGDLYQLPPIVEKKEEKILKERFDYEIFYFFGSKVFKKMKLHVKNLTKVYRQKDLDFIELLDRVRFGKIEKKDIEVFKKRCLRNPDKLPFTPVIVTSTNKNVKKYNMDKLKDITFPSHYYQAEVSGKYPEEQMPVNLVLELKIGARVMLLRNLNGRFVNGDLGTIMACDKKCVIVKVDRTGENEIVFKEKWDKYEFYYDTNIGKIRKWISATIKQIPIKLAWAMTIHKSQGLTLTNIYVDPTPGIWEPGQLYVALSRCTSLKGLYLKDIPKFSDFYSNYIVDKFFDEASA